MNKMRGIQGLMQNYYIDELQVAEELDGDITFLQSKFESAEKQLYDCKRKVELALKNLHEAENEEVLERKQSTKERPARYNYEWDDYYSDSDEDNESRLSGETNQAYSPEDPDVIREDGPESASVKEAPKKKRDPLEVARLRITCNQVRAEAARLENIVAQRQAELIAARDAFRKRMKHAEAELLRAAEFGDTYAVKVILKGNRDVNADVIDVLGRTPLHLAVKNDNLEIVDLLLDLSSPKNVYECLLLSISQDNDQISETILRHSKYEQAKDGAWEEDLVQEDATQVDSLFSSDITPLMLAAHRNQFNIVRKLLMQGETIEEPHVYNCNCMACTASVMGDVLRHAKTRLHAYRGLASEAYICLSSRDPLLSTFLLGHKLRKLSHVEKHFKAEYTELAEKLSEYAVKLLEHVRTGQELDQILNESESRNIGTDQLRRLKLAMKYDQKKFVAHASCQRKLTSIWYRDVQKSEQSNMFLDAIKVIAFTIAYPIIFILYWIHPLSRIGDFLRVPMMKFVAHSMSYIVFLILIALYTFSEQPAELYKLTEYPYKTAVRSYYDEYVQNVTAQGQPFLLHDVMIRPYSIGYGTYTICIWVVGMAFKSMKHIYAENIFAFANNFYNLMDFTMQACYGASFTLRILVSLKVQSSLQYFSARAAWEALCKCQTCALEKAYWLNADRYYWDRWDPFSLSEALFAVANVISWVRLSYLLAVNERIGPLQITFRRLLLDVSKFMWLFIMFLVAYLLGFVNLFWYYVPGTRMKAELANDRHSATIAEENFGTVFNTFRTIFWSIFGMAESNMVEFGPEWETVSFGFTTAVAYVLFGTYSLLTIILLVNMLIAIMARSYEIIIRDEDAEWKFARTKLYMDYIQQGDTIAVPFNLIPTWKVFYDMCSGCCKQKTNDDKLGATFKLGEGFGHGIGLQTIGIGRSRSLFLPKNKDDEELLGVPLTKYEQTIRKVVKRYISQGSASDSKKPEEGAVDESLKRDVNNFRYEAMSAIRGQNRQQSDLTESITTMEKQVVDMRVDFDKLQERLVEAEKLNSEFQERMTSERGDADKLQLDAISEVQNEVNLTKQEVEKLRVRLGNAGTVTSYTRPPTQAYRTEPLKASGTPHSYLPQNGQSNFTSNWRSSSGVPLANTSTSSSRPHASSGQKDNDNDYIKEPVEIPRWAQPTSDDSDSEITASETS